jgi:hypothetical protein
MLSRRVFARQNIGIGEEGEPDTGALEIRGSGRFSGICTGARGAYPMIRQILNGVL